MNNNNYVAIMAGGIGSRFWPESRQHLPKQFLDLLGTGCSLLQATFERCKNICPAENIFIVTHKTYADLVKEQIPELHHNNIVCEPFRKNTAPAAAYITYKIHALNPNANILMAPADHLIIKEIEFCNVAKKGLSLAEENQQLITFGIKPTRPDTGYGYIQYQQEEVVKPVYKVKTFTEKPTLELAKTFLQSGDFLWNSGIFCWNAKSFLSAVQMFLPEIEDAFKHLDGFYNTIDEPKLIDRIYSLLPNISIDYGIMEKAKNVYVIPASFGWSDLGTWESAYEHSDKDYLGNAIKGENVMIIDASECMVKAPHKKLVVLQGLEKYIVIDTDDVLLVCERSREQQIKEYVAEVNRQKGELFS